MKNVAQQEFTLSEVRDNNLRFSNYFNLLLRLFYCIISLLFMFQDNQRVKFMANTYGWDSLPVKFKIDFLKLCWVCAPSRNVRSQIFADFFLTPFLLIVYKFVLSRVVFNYIQRIFQYYFLLQFCLFFYSILISFHIYNFILFVILLSLRRFGKN